MPKASSSESAPCCPALGGLTEGEPGYQVFSRRPTAWDHVMWRNHLGVNFLHCHSCWDLVSMTDWDQRFRVGLAWHWEGTACSLLKLSSEQLEILQTRRHQKYSVINESSFSHNADLINIGLQGYHIKTQNFKRNLWNHEVLTHRQGDQKQRWSDLLKVIQPIGAQWQVYNQVSGLKFWFHFIFSASRRLNSRSSFYLSFKGVEKWSRNYQS